LDFDSLATSSSTLFFFVSFVVLRVYLLSWTAVHLKEYKPFYLPISAGGFTIKPYGTCCLRLILTGKACFKVSI